MRRCVLSISCSGITLCTTALAARLSLSHPILPLLTDKKRRCLAAARWLSLLSWLLAGCQAPALPTHRIGFSQCSNGDAWRRAMLAGMQKELSFYPEVSFRMKDTRDSTGLQEHQIQELLREGADLLIVSANEARPITPVVEEAYNRGIPVVILDRRITWQQYTAYVGGNNEEVGQIAGRYASGLLRQRSQRNQIPALAEQARIETEAKLRFFTNFSHELRTLLTLIMGPVEELFTNGADLSKTQRHDLGLVRRNTQRLLQLVNQLLDFRKIEVGKMLVRTTKGNLVALVRELLDVFEKPAQQRGMEGFRCFDLTRWGIAAPYLNTYLTKEKTPRQYLSKATFTAGRDEYLPIPLTQINLSRGLCKQNNGW